MIFSNQSAKLRFLDFNRYAPLEQHLDVVPSGLTHLKINDVIFDTAVPLPWQLITLSRNKLQHLRLGSECNITERYLKNSDPALFDDTIRPSLTQAVIADLPEKYHVSILILCLSSLMLCGVHGEQILDGDLGIQFDFENLTTLTLESCPELLRALKLFISTTGSAPTLKLPKLDTLFIRQELVEDDYDAAEVFDDFFKSLPGLVQLEVLIEYPYEVEPLNFESVLKVHGKTLLRLLWEERHKMRSEVDDSPSIFKENCLEIVAQYCPHLQALALALDWKRVIMFIDNHIKVFENTLLN